MKVPGAKMLMLFGALFAMASVLECHSVYVEPGQVVQMLMDGDDTGHATNCGHEPFTFTWTPKDLDPSGKVTLTLSYRVPHDFNGGYVNASAYFHNEKQPFIGYADHVSCDDIKKYFPLCPIKKGFYLHQSKTIYDLHSIAVFPGTYDFKATVWNEKKEEMFCIFLTVKIDRTSSN